MSNVHSQWLNNLLISISSDCVHDLPRLVFKPFFWPFKLYEANILPIIWLVLSFTPPKHGGNTVEETCKYRLKLCISPHNGPILYRAFHVVLSNLIWWWQSCQFQVQKVKTLPHFPVNTLLPWSTGLENSLKSVDPELVWNVFVAGLCSLWTWDGHHCLNGSMSFSVLWLWEWFSSSCIFYRKILEGNLLIVVVFFSPIALSYLLIILISAELLIADLCLCCLKWRHARVLLPHCVSAE